ncbi:DsbE family thiol:disulfide interchange protein [Coralliovum pocilloporae]|uniref:DsbE family thiol:disulfide interchange protein n=1 Tax=Coralliovum pocilloporae TaxID=3066369 RepID=UPI003306E6C2
MSEEASVAVKKGSGLRIVLILLPLIIFLALAGLFFERLGSGDNPNNLPSALKGKPAPEFTLPALDGTGVPGFSRADLKGQVTLVNIWASWCVPCRQEHPIINELAKDDRFKVFGLNYKDTPDNARAFLTELGNSFDAIGVDPKGRTGIDWGVYGVPETFVVDRNGVIRYKFIGPLTARSKRDILMPEIEKVLAAQ